MKVSWIFARNDRRAGRWYYHQNGYNTSWTEQTKDTAYRFTTKEEARARMRKFAKDWKHPRRMMVLIRITTRPAAERHSVSEKGKP